MTRAHTPAERYAELEFHVSGFLVKVEGFLDGSCARSVPPFSKSAPALALEFAELAPGHSNQWKRARKIIRPTLEDFEENLEVDGGQGFIPYYTIPMRKITS